MFGGVKIYGGLIALFLLQVGGGVVLDLIGSTIPNALGLCAAAVFAGGVFCALSFAAAQSLAQFAPLFAAGELGLFALQVMVGDVFSTSFHRDFALPWQFTSTNPEV